MTISLGPRDVMSVYSGRSGQCCCGCAGKHSYNSAYQSLAGRNRGYDVTDDEVSDKNVTRILNKLKAADPDTIDVGSNYIASTDDRRIYIVYPKPFGWKA